MTVLALDIGGANLKIADGRGFGLSQFFPLWKTPELLPQALSELIARAPQAEQIVATMTGELADCYRTKAEGVRAIVAAVRQAAGRRSVRIYLTDGSLAKEDRRLGRAALGRRVELACAGFLFLPAAPGRLWLAHRSWIDDLRYHSASRRPAGSARSDRSTAFGGWRVGLHGRHAKSGFGRRAQPPWQGLDCPVAQELFATTWDAYLVRGDLPEERDSRHTADGRPATRACAEDRLARSICADRSLVSVEDLRGMAEVIARAQLLQIERPRAAGHRPAGGAAAVHRHQRTGRIPGAPGCRARVASSRRDFAGPAAWC